MAHRTANVPGLRSTARSLICRNRLALAFLVWVGPCALANSTRAEAPVEFNRDIRPILSENCFHCHGPDAAARQADLRLDRAESAFESAISPGRPDQSELIRRVTSSDESERMPPVDSERSLTAEDISLLRQWIEAGAEYQPHWSLIPPTRPELPPVQQQDWCRNEIDYFVLARLEEAGRAPSPEAAREMLLRRVTFDLTGLPPTISEIDAFLADESPQAYEAVVDRLLASARYGERMTADWLDLARYSDTYGYQVDRDRFVWPWRDWVIGAFNENMPYDKFVTLQLAGDLLEGAGRDEILATTFNRLHPQKVEGGSVPEEFRIEYVADRTQTFGTAFLGLTLECCRCHDHKYDPITQQEYYQLSAFFDNIDEAGLYSYFTPSVPTPTLLLPTDEQQSQIDAFRREVNAAEAALAQAVADARASFEKWRQSIRGGVELPQPIAHLSFEEPPSGPNAQVDGPVGKAVRLTGDDAVSTEVGNFVRSQPFSVALWMQTPDVKERAVVFHRSRAWTDAGSRGYQLLLEDGRLSWSLIHFWPGNAIRVRAVDPLPVGQWHHVVVTYDGSSRAAGLEIWVNGDRAEVEVVRDHLTKQITGGGGDTIAIGERFRDRGFTGGDVDEFRVYESRLTPLEISHLHAGTQPAAESWHAGDLSEADSRAAAEFYAARIDESVASRRAALQEARTRHNKVLDAVDEIMVMRELAEPRPSYLLKRGMYDARGTPVVPETPAVLPERPDGLPANRLGLARWLTDPRHPLTSRVAVNRLWQMCFGRGLVTTPEDFGSQGKPPTHPRLLDWLAVDFAENGWDIKRLLRQIVTSATYRQSSAIGSPGDPENRLLGRGPSYRLPAEMLRDNALAVSGLLVDRIGGPPAKPYEVEESFKPTDRDEGEGLYRRSLYTYWKRTGPAPVMMTLDAAKRDVCRVARERTSSPLQSLVLMNGPQYVEASRVLAEDLVMAYGDDRRAALTELFRRLTTRRPNPQELAVLQRLYEQQQTRFGENPEAAEAYLSIGDRPRERSLPAEEVAALAAVAGTLLNYDGCVTKR